MKKKNNFAKAQELIKKITNTFSLKKFEDLDKTMRDIIDDDLWKLIDKNNEANLNRQLNSIFELTFSWGKKQELIHDFYELTKKHNIKFYTTRTFRAYARVIFFCNLKADKKIDFINNLKEYLTYVNNKYFMINARLSTDTINATKLRKYDFYSKINTLLKKYNTAYDLSPYDEYIKSQKTMDKETFYNFIQELNKYKISKSIIPYEICKYLICQMLKPDSPISADYKFWANLRECVFCDFISNILKLKYKTNDYFSCVIKFKNGKRGKHNKEQKIICLDDNVVYNFSSNNARAITTMFHELRHFEQANFLKECIDGQYRILKEKIVCNENLKFKKKNYWILYNEIDARKYGTINAIKFLEKEEVDVTDLRITEGQEDLKLLGFQKRTLEDCEASFCKNYQKLNIQKRLVKILKNNCKIIEENPILKYEFNENGTRKTNVDMLTGLEKAFTEKEIDRKTLVDILNFSIFSEEYITKNNRNTNAILKYKYTNNKFKTICIKTLFQKLQTEILRTQFYEDTDRADKVNKCLTEQIEVLK
ncbi:MAG: hypothetical protein IKP28_03660 [Clostridia bacterium]|nr:hypothetical protein [Clostridia bacterium]